MAPTKPGWPPAMIGRGSRTNVLLREVAFLRIRKATYREKVEYVKTPPSRKQGLKPKVKKTMVKAVEPCAVEPCFYLLTREGGDFTYS